MHVGNSFKIAAIKTGLTPAIIAERMGVKVDRVYQLRRTRVSTTCTHLERLAAAFRMKVSDFIALGETDVRTTDDSADSPAAPGA
jgi:hypothetical protein